MILGVPAEELKLINEKIVTHDGRETNEHRNDLQAYELY